MSSPSRTRVLGSRRKLNLIYTKTCLVSQLLASFPDGDRHPQTFIVA